MADKPRDPNELGALWISDRGDYMTGKINGEAVVVFRNDRKPAGSTQPDWRVLRKTKKEQAPVAPPATFDDEIPF